MHSSRSWRDARARRQGAQLQTFLIRRYAHEDLRKGGLFLEIGMDEALLNYPWELMHFGEDFLCLRHYVGRHVISRSPATRAKQPSSILGSSLKTLSILLISVPNPQPRESPGGRRIVYDALPEAAAETKAIVDTVSGIKGVKLDLLQKRNATYDDVFSALRREQYHIIHFNGHAHFDDQNPYRSGLVLFDDDMETGELESLISLKPPILCFINACETAKSVDATGAENRLDMYGLARAFLDTGAYLLGSRWKVQDATAKEFAEKFYTSLIKDGKSLGEAIALSRRACKAVDPADPFGWASYVYYGDPRVCFQGLEPETNPI
jgi:CHAT domain-containing protein